MNIKEKNIDGILLIYIEERDANLAIAEQFKQLVLQRIASGETKLIISFKYVSYLDSSFLGTLVSILKNLLPIQGKVVMIELNADILSLFEITRLDKVFLLRESLEKALEEFNK